MSKDICESCGCELKVCGSRYEFEGDDSPDTPTVLYSVVDLKCANPACGRLGSVITVRNIVKQANR